MPDHTARIAEIREILQRGVTTVSFDGVTVTYDFDALRRELRELMAEDEAQAGRRPVAQSIYLGGF